ncbi:hypothetical protein ACKVMT_13830 [Halobacteriales archaeon Cl-PHB]
MTGPSRGAAASEPDRPTYPKVKDSIGEDPARFLCRREKWVAKARIRGIHLFEIIEAWRAVERNLAVRRGKEPREWVMEALAKREAYLEDHGEVDPDPEPPEIDPGPYTPDLWKDRTAGSLPPITPHEENIARPATDGGEPEA